jgi:hypothetical protein
MFGDLQSQQRSFSARILAGLIIVVTAGALDGQNYDILFDVIEDPHLRPYNHLDRHDIAEIMEHANAILQEGCRESNCKPVSFGVGSLREQALPIHLGPGETEITGRRFFSGSVLKVHLDYFSSTYRVLTEPAQPVKSQVHRRGARQASLRQAQGAFPLCLASPLT